MGFREEIIKDKRKVTPYLLFAQSLNTGNWDGPAVRVYSSKVDATGPKGAIATVESFGTFARSLANSLFSLEIPTITTRFLDPTTVEWHRYANEPYDTILRKWIHYLLRVHDDDDLPWDATVALGQIINLSYPPGRRSSITASVASPELLGERIPNRTVLESDWENAPLESRGQPVPIIYGRHSNEFETEEEEEPEPEGCGDCPLWTPPPFSVDPPSNPDRPGIRWSDDFSQVQGGVRDHTWAVESPHVIGDFFGLDPHPDFPSADWTLIDGWLAENYHSVWGGNIVAGAGPNGSNAWVSARTYESNNGHFPAYANFTRGVGINTFGYPDWFEWSGETAETPVGLWAGAEPWDLWPPRWGRNQSQYGACSMLHYWEPERDSLPDLMTVWGNGGGVASGPMFRVMQWSPDEDISDPATFDSLVVQVGGGVHRKNGAYDWGKYIGNVPALLGIPVDSGVTGDGFWQTIAMRHILVPNTWQKIEMKWKCSSFSSGDESTVFPPEDTEATSTNADGWLIVRVDGQVVIHLQEIELSYHNTWPTAGLYDTPIQKDSWKHWESVTFMPNGRATCIVVSDRLWCDEAVALNLDEADPCAEHMVETGTGALPTVVVDFTESTADYMLCGHAIDPADVRAFAPLPGIRERLGGLNLMTGEKEPITFEETEARMTELIQGTDFEVLTVEKDSGRFTILRVLRNMRDVNTCEFAPVTVNCTGIRTNADGTGDLIEDGPLILRHFLLNWVFNRYTTGEWFTDVAAAPGIVDSPSYEQAAADILSSVGFSYVGAVALITPTDARTLIQEALTTFGLHFFYKSALLQDRGAWSVVFHNLRQGQVEWATAPLFDQFADMGEGTFETTLSMDLLRNFIYYKAGPSYVGSRGWLITSAIEHTGSMERYGRVEGELLLPWTRHLLTAVDRAEMEIAVRRHPIVFGTFLTKGRGVLTDPGTIIRVAHEDAPGLGWEDRPCLTIGNDLGLDAGAVGIRFISPVSMIE